jgi:hypothetical protein
MLAELAAANAAFAVIKKCVQNGRELTAAGTAIANFVTAKEELQRKGNKKKGKGAGGPDLEEFMALEKIREQEEQLKLLMIYTGRPGLWNDWQKFQAEARKSRRVQEELAKRKRQELIEAIAIGGLLTVIAAVVVAFFWWLYIMKQAR